MTGLHVLSQSRGTPDFNPWYFYQSGRVTLRPTRLISKSWNARLQSMVLLPIWTRHSFSDFLFDLNDKRGRLLNYEVPTTISFHTALSEV